MPIRRIGHERSGRTLLALALLVGIFALGAGPCGPEPEPDAPPPDPLPSELLEPEEPPPSVQALAVAQEAVVEAAEPLSPIAATWVAQGPGPSQHGQVENIANREVTGAIHTVAAHPTDPNILYVGAANGGVWRTRDATSSSPSWVPLTDDQRGLSIGALEMDPADPETLLAGIGRYSSFGTGGQLTGLLVSTDAGDSWTPLVDPLLVGENISGVAVRGELMLASSNRFGGTGVARSTDFGATWSSVSGSCCGLTAGRVFDLVGDPSDPDRFYASVANTGLFRSDDGGASWANVSANDTGPGSLHETITNGGNNNTEMAVAPDARLYAAVLLFGQASWIGHSSDLGLTWTAMDLPQTRERNGDVEGLNPRMKPGSQGGIHFSIRADPDVTTTFYVGGDRQDGPFPNFLFAGDFTGRLFRGDTVVAPTGGVPSPQWEHLTHFPFIAAIPGGGTFNLSSPHADSREMVFDAVGDLIEVDDGGIYRRTSPKDNTGGWFSMNGNLQVAEQHDIAYDSNAKILISGNQDTGTTEQIAPGGTTWRTVSRADGGDVVVDDSSTPGISTRYSSFQNLRSFRRRDCNASNACGRSFFPALEVVSGGPLQPQFVTPLALNVVDPRRLLIGAGNSVYESFDRGERLYEVPGPGPNGTFSDPMVYGHDTNPDLIVIASGSSVFVRTTAGGPLVQTPTRPGGQLRDVIVHPIDAETLFANSTTQVFHTDDGGTTWNDITSNLRSVEGAGNFRSLAYIEDGTTDKLVVGTDLGAYLTVEGSLGTWFEIGENLPNVPVWDLEYDAADDVLAAGTLGRGAWTLADASLLNAPPVAVCADATLLADELCGARVDPADVDGGSFDPDGDPFTLTVEPAALTAGDAEVRLTVTDAQGANHACTAAVRVVDESPPLILDVTLTPDELWAPNHELVPVDLALTVLDNCDPDPACWITGVASNEPIDGPGDGSTDPDWELYGPLDLVLRAERSGPGDGRVYTVMLACTDEAGNQGPENSDSVAVVEHDQGS